MAAEGPNGKRARRVEHSPGAMKNAARVLSALVVAADDELAEFRERRCDSTPDVELGKLAQARDLLEWIDELISEGDEAAWHRLQEAWQFVHAGPPPAIDEPDEAVDSDPEPELESEPEPQPVPEPEPQPVPVPMVADAPRPLIERSPPPPDPLPPRLEPLLPRIDPSPPPRIDRPSPPSRIDRPSPPPRIEEPALAQNPKPAAAPLGYLETALPFRGQPSGAGKPAAAAPADYMATVLPFFRDAGGAARAETPDDDGDALGQTRALEDGLLDNATLPFIDADVSPPAPAARAEWHFAKGATTEMPAMPWLAAVPVADDEPSKGDSASLGAQLDLQRFASFCVERALYPDWIEAVRGRYQVADADAEQAIELHWQAELAGKPELRRQFDEHCVRYREWLAANRLDGR